MFADRDRDVLAADPGKIEVCGDPEHAGSERALGFLTLLAEAKANADLEVMGEMKPLPFDRQGNLEQEKLFPHCWRARRVHG